MKQGRTVTDLYLDMNIYNRPFDDQSQMRIHLETTAVIVMFALVEQGLFSVKWSFVLDYENSRNPFPERRAFVEHLAQACEMTIEPVPSILELARHLADGKNVGNRDALHLACAELAGCDYFVTCDDHLVQRGQRLIKDGVLTVQTINPVDMVREV